MRARVWAAAALPLAALPLALALAVPDQGGDSKAKAETDLSPAAIDAALAAAHSERGIRPAPVVGDAAFLRRLSLDVRGVIPTVEEVAAFARERSRGKRARWIERFLGAPEFARHQGQVLRAHLLAGARTNEELEPSRAGFQAWLTERVAKDTGWNRIAAEVVAAEGRSDANPAIFYTLQHAGPEAQMAEEMAGRVLKQFLGLSLECARCHDHPFTSWKQADYHRQAAWFARLRVRETEARDGEGEAFVIRETPLGEHRTRLLKGGFQEFEPGFLGKAVAGGVAPRRHTRTSRRARFARWMTAPDNPWFARAAVDRVWAQLFGRGLVETLDDSEVSSDPRRQLLVRLGRGFTKRGYSLKALFRALLNSQAYQRGLRPAAGDLAEARKRFAAATPRPLDAPVLLDSLLRAGGRDRPAPGELASTRRRVRKHLLTELQRVLPGMAQRGDADFITTLQGLFLINGRSTTALAGSVALSAVLKAGSAPAARVEQLYLRALARRPSARERRRAVAYLDQARGTRAAYVDLFWALLASSEFGTNH